ncbi:MAG: hypothetical protein WB873_10105 [Thermoplasmata archaeon]
MRSADAAAVRCRASYRARRSLYHRLAHGVAGARGPAGAVFEAVATERIPWVIVRPARLAEGLTRDSRGAYAPVDFAPTPMSPRPAVRSHDRFGVVLPLSANVPESREDVPMGAPPLDHLLGPGGWLAFQTFWIRGPRGDLCIARRFRYAAPSRSARNDRFDAVAAAVAYDWSIVTGVPAIGRRSGTGSALGWRRRDFWGLPRAAWLARGPEAVDATAEVRWVGATPVAGPPAGHAVVFGSSGAGKTTYLAHRAAEAIARGERVVAIDIHGDLAPAILGHLAPEHRERVLAVDAGERPVPGIAALPKAGDDDRAAALFVAAVKRLSADGTDVYWGFRMERIFDSFVRLVQECDGSLLDLYDLLTSEERREAARLATRRPELAQFLDELEPVVRRNPDFLWSAVTRISKVALVPALAELLAPKDGGMPVEEIVSAGRSLLVRLPFARLGPEAATLAGTLILARVFLGLAGRPDDQRRMSPVLVVLDEVQGFSPRLVAEVLAESRKFGLRAIVATQYPERLVPEVRSAAAGASTQFVAFRVPPPSAAEAGAWLGLDRPGAERLLASLPPGGGVEFDPETGLLGSVVPAPVSDSARPTGWADAVARTQAAYAAPDPAESETPAADPATERLLLAVLAAEEERCPLDDLRVVSAALALPGPPLDPATLADRWTSIRRREWVTASDGRYHLSPAGARWIGLGRPTRATRESAEHRRLLMRTFRVFARRGYRLEILRQGRFDTTLPDARFRHLSSSAGAPAPEELARAIDRARPGWAWRFFRGRDVHVEAEVSGALRPERIRHGCAKAAGRDAFVLFVVGDAPRARKVRAVLDRLGIGRDRANVWTLPLSAEPKS